MKLYLRVQYILQVHCMQDTIRLYNAIFLHFALSNQLIMFINSKSLGMPFLFLIAPWIHHEDTLPSLSLSTHTCRNRRVPPSFPNQTATLEQLCAAVYNIRQYLIYLFNHLGTIWLCHYFAIA